MPTYHPAKCLFPQSLQILELETGVEVRSSIGIDGAGIVVFETNRVFGGDSRYYYLGSYFIRETMLIGVVKVTHYAYDRYSIFGDLAEFNLKVEGKMQIPIFDALGFRVDQPDQRIGLRFTKQAELP